MRHAGLEKPSCTYKATVAYDGTAYKGFQLQNPPDKRKLTIQGELEACLTTIFNVDRRPLKVQGAGRTDSGVHARGQVRHPGSPAEHQLPADNQQQCLLPVMD